jgi:3',5'-cyclic AMP phosphodiesterase CpdA
VSSVKSAAPSPSEGKSSEQITGGEGKGYLFAHISDPHLSTLEGVRRRDLLNKRLLGYLSWKTHRREEHRADVLAALVRDLKHCRPQHTVITGDLTHLGLPGEFLEVAHWLSSLGPPEQFTVIPGNHETYARSPWEETFAHWLPYLASDAPLATPAGTLRDGLFPSLRTRDHIAFIGLSSARPSAPLLAVGSLGRAQLQALNRILAETGERGLFRVLLIHHPPLAETLGWRKRLTDNRALRTILERQGVELVLHGHAHRATRGWLDTAADRTPVIGVPSASAIGHKPGRRARYNLCRVSRTASGWDLRIEARVYAPELDSFVAAGKVLECASHQYNTKDQDDDNRRRDHEQGAQVQHEAQIGQ